MNNYIEDLVIEETRLIHRNFEGRAGKYNRAGDRSVSVVIDPTRYNIDELANIGWAIRTLPPREGVEGSEPLYYIPVRVNLDSGRPPKVYLVTSRNKIELDNESIASLDHADIRFVDVVIHPSRWEVNGKSGVKAYLKSMYVIINEDVLASKYENVGLAPVSDIGELSDVDNPY